jgi:16S rRNA (cytosine1402-N4)-methyltransferase
MEEQLKKWHIPVMVDQVLFYLDPRKGDLIVDYTVGSGGHARAILEEIVPGGRLVGIDRDQVALEAAREQLQQYEGHFVLVQENFKNVDSIFTRLGVEAVDGSLFDLGLSSLQIESPGRGFSYLREERLDMRMDRSAPLTAYDIVNSYAEDSLAEIFRKYGEERWAKRIAHFIVQERVRDPVVTTIDLVGLVEQAIPRGKRRRGHPAKRIFQALRIEVNDELNSLEAGLRGSFERLRKGGRLVVISYHSLEDRLVKSIFRELAEECICPKELPQCQCGGVKKAKILTKKSVTPSIEERSRNPRSASARLRAMEKIQG